MDHKQKIEEIKDGLNKRWERYIMDSGNGSIDINVPFSNQGFLSINITLKKYFKPKNKSVHLKIVIVKPYILNYAKYIITDEKKDWDKFNENFFKQINETMIEIDAKKKKLQLEEKRLEFFKIELEGITSRYIKNFTTFQKGIRIFTDKEKSTIDVSLTAKKKKENKFFVKFERSLNKDQYEKLLQYIKEIEDGE